MLKNLKEFNLPEIEEKVLKFWQDNQVFEKSLKSREGEKPFCFYEGPPTANGRPGIHHVLSRAFKDIILRYKTMRGFFVRRKAGWDTHGLPVEIEVEKELGFKNKQEIEKFGIAEFNEKARASVWKYKDEWEKVTERIGFWMDMKNPYITYQPEYMESLWWAFKQIAKKGLLKKSFKIVPYCPRCQTALSSHEMGQPDVYRKVKDPSIFIKFEITGGKPKNKIKEYLLVWTTTPWTLPANLTIAVNPSLTYTKYKIGNEFIWSYNVPPVEAQDLNKIEVVEKISGKNLVGLTYKPLFNIKGPWLKNKKFFRVYGADFVETAEGTGLVHIAPAFGEDDMSLISKYEKDLVGKIPITIDEGGLVTKGVPGAGKFVKQADKDIMEDLQKRGFLFKSGMAEHDYPFCWRCSTPLLYFSKFSWFIMMSQLKNGLLKNNERINWIPGHIKNGRFGEWIKEVKDWAISRDRYWGTPLPIWQCVKCGATEVVGGLEDLNKLRYTRNNFWILRHGETPFNLNGIIAAGKNDVARMTDKGIKEIDASVKKLIKNLGKNKLDFIFTSPYLRTKETSKIIAKATGAKIIADKRLSELDCGVLNGKTVKEHRAFFSNELERFTKAPEGGESLNDVKKRLLQFLEDINGKYNGKNVLIVSHGDPLWVLEGVVKNLKDKEIIESPYIKTGELKGLNVNNWPHNQFSYAVDLHRPYIDKIYLKCPKCKSKMERVKEVADVWFDSGAMPFAQNYFPFSLNNPKKDYTDLIKNIDFPADYISEGMDQTRGWFYTMLAISTALGLGPSYLNVITLGLVLDKNGQKMSKSKGNVVSPWDVIQKYGVDTLRWYFYTVNPAGEAKRFDEAELGKVLRKFAMIIYNSFVFLETYGVKKSGGKIGDKNILDKWILSRLNKTISEVTDLLEKYEPGNAGRVIEVFVDDLSRWHIRRSRRRFQKPVSVEDLEAASLTLWYCLSELAKLIAPFTPFFAESLYQSLKTSGSALSVHLEDWPKADNKFLDSELLGKMEEVRKFASLALSLRAEKKIKVRQPLRELRIKNKELGINDKGLLELLKDEVNVKEIKFDSGLEKEVDLDFEITPELKAEGTIRDFIRVIQGLRQDAGYVPKDKILLAVEAESGIKNILVSNESLIKKEVGAKTLEFKRVDKFDAEEDAAIDGQKIWAGIRKI